MDVVLAVVTSALGSAGILGFVQFLISRHDRKHSNNDTVKAQLDRIENKCGRNELATTRLQLIYLIDRQPENKDAILHTAQRYFIELNGNGEAWAVFDTWAKAKKLDLAWYKMLLEKKEKHNAKCD